MARTREFDEDTVLDKAVALFSSKGYYDTSVQDMVTCLDLSRSSLYDTFGDKRQLFLRALERYRTQSAAAMTRAFSTAAHARPRLEALFEGVIRDSLADVHQGCLMVNTSVELAPHDPEVAALIQANMQGMEDLLAEVLVQGQGAGEVGAAHDARLLARFLQNTISGLRVMARAGTEESVLRGIIVVALDVCCPRS